MQCPPGTGTENRKIGGFFAEYQISNNDWKRERIGTGMDAMHCVYTAHTGGFFVILVTVSFIRIFSKIHVFVLKFKIFI
jgi:hypothetical protein